MRTLKKNWGKFAGAATLAGVAIIAVYACISAWGQTLPGVSMVMTNSNSALWLTVTNGVSTSKYQVYSKEDLRDVDWILETNGYTGQTNFLISTGDAVTGFYRAVLDTNIVDPSLSITITAPAGGANVQ